MYPLSDVARKRIAKAVQKKISGIHEETKGDDTSFETQELGKVWCQTYIWRIEGEVSQDWSKGKQMAQAQGSSERYHFIQFPHDAHCRHASHKNCPGSIVTKEPKAKGNDPLRKAHDWCPHSDQSSCDAPGFSALL